MLGILLLSIPVFYIWGIISFIYFLVKESKRNKSRKEYVGTLVNELRKKNEKEHILSVSDLIASYEHEIEQLSESSSASTAVRAQTDTKEKAIIDEHKVAESNIAQAGGEVPSRSSASFWGNWYTDNSINLLLYTGAFFIVLSTLIYIGFQWDQLQAIAKALVLSVISLAFLGFGWWFFTIERIQKAGTVFLAIGAILIPFNGISWYTFVLKDAGVSAGSVWVITSLLAIVVYAILARKVNAPNYTYLSTISSYSLFLAFVNTSGLSQQYYVLAGISCSCSLLFVDYVVRTVARKTSDKVLLLPVSTSAQIFLPITLVYGLFMAETSAFLVSYETATALLLSGIFYITSYRMQPKRIFLATGLTLFAASCGMFGLSWQLSFMVVFSLLCLVGVIYALFADLFSFQDSDVLRVVGLFLVYVVAGIAFFKYLAFANETFYFLLIGLSAFLVSTYEFTKLKAEWAENAFCITFFLFAYGMTQFFHFTSFFTSVSLVSGGFFLLLIRLSLSLSSYHRYLSATVATLFLTAFAIYGSLGATYDQVVYLYAGAAACGVVARWIHKNAYFLFYTQITLAFGIIAFSSAVAPFQNVYLVNTILFGLGAVLWYGAPVIIGSEKKQLLPYLFGSMVYVALSIFTAEEHINVVFIPSLAAFGMVLDASLRYKRPELQLLLGATATLAIWSLLFFLPIAFASHGLILTLSAIVLYIMLQALPATRTHFTQEGMWVVFLVSPWLENIDPNTMFFSNAFYAVAFKRFLFFTDHSWYVISALAVSIAALSYLAWKKKQYSFWYLVGAHATLSFLWLLQALSITNMNAYTISVGLYFLVLGFVEGRRGSSANSTAKDMIDGIGFVLLYINPVVKSLDTLHGAYDALILGLLGLVLFFVGVTSTSKRYTYVGLIGIVVAIVSQAYSYVLSLPRWIITAGAGVVFLSVAIFLLLKRAEKEK